MRNKILITVGLFLLVSPSMGEESVITNRNLSIFSFVDVGQAVKGSSDGPDVFDDVEKLFLYRSGIALMSSGTVNENLDMVVGLGGLMWKPYPTTTHKPSRQVLTGPGVAEASAKYRFNDKLSLKMGYFGYQYNEDATNLGEYLLKSEAYPSYIETGGWVWVNSAAYRSLGANLNWTLMGGAFSQDLLIFSEFSRSPVFDFSPAYVASFKTKNGFKIGGGISLHRLIPVKPSVTTPNDPSTLTQQISYSGGVSWVADITYIDPTTGMERTAFGENWKEGTVFDANAFLAANAPGGTITEIKVTQRGSAANTPLTFTQDVHQSLQYCDGNGACRSYYNSSKDSVLMVDVAGDTVFRDINGNVMYTPLSVANEQKLTFKGTKLMGFVSLDFNEMFGLPLDRFGPFKIFIETAVLGVQNQPVFYEDIAQRIPVMFGVHIPTGGLLDMLSIQMQYFPNKLPDNRSQIDNFSLPLPGMPDGYFEMVNRREAGDFNTDDVKWSVFLKKSVLTGFDVFIQVANDHFRTQNSYGEPGHIPLTNEKDHWYYLARLQWSL